MRAGAAFRGQPLLVLAGLLAGWLGLRVALWEPPLGAAPGPLHSKSEVVADQRVAVPDGASPAIRLPQAVRSDHRFATSAAAAPHATMLAAGPPTAAQVLSSARDRGPTKLTTPAGTPLLTEPAPPGIPTAAAFPIPPRPRTDAVERRWSVDAWAMLRDDTTTPILSGRPSYGRSQAGAVVRYRLASESALRPEAYIRASTALAGPREDGVAAGVSARLPGLPVRVAAEGRVENTSLGTKARPAVFAVTELPVLSLPLGLRGEAYAQAGYVGGDFATAFVDGQAAIDRPVARVGGATLALGGGVWGGAQEGADRLDVGPAASLRFSLGQAFGRLSLDYRFRVAGDAEPSSGPAMTLSAGF